MLGSGYFGSGEDWAGSLPGTGSFGVSGGVLVVMQTTLAQPVPRTLRRVCEDATTSGVAPASAEDTITWLTARFAGEEVEETGCG